jgi:hypothetical protein
MIKIYIGGKRGYSSVFFPQIQDLFSSRGMNKKIFHECGSIPKVEDKSCVYKKNWIFLCITNIFLLDITI